MTTEISEYEFFTPTVPRNNRAAAERKTSTINVFILGDSNLVENILFKRVWTDEAEIAIR